MIKDTKVVIEMYDPAVKEAPYSFITLREEVIPLNLEAGDSGKGTYKQLVDLCNKHGYRFRFWSCSNGDVHAVVRNTDPNIHTCVLCGCDVYSTSAYCDECNQPYKIISHLMANKL